MFDKKEKLFSHEVENLKLQFIEEKEQLKENVNELSKEREQIIQENMNLRDQIIRRKKRNYTYKRTDEDGQKGSCLGA